MKKIYIMSLLGVCIASILFCSSVALASDDFRFYFEGEVGGSFADFDSGGWQSYDNFPNTGDDDDEAVITGIHFGAELFEYLRADIGFSHRGDLDFTTNSYPLPTSPFFYKTKIEDIYSLIFSLYFEPIHYKKFTPYVGAGVGSTWAKISTNDTEVKGSRDKAIFSWQAEAGIQYDLTQRLTLKLGYHYIDMGNLEVHLRGVDVDWRGNESVVSVGKYRGELTANEVILGLRYSF
jgi:opacity protein-like surface antigen